MEILAFFVLIALILVFIGIYFTLNAIWELRTGENRMNFLKKGMFGIGFLVLAFIIPYLFGIAAMMPARHNPTLQSQSSIPIQSVAPSTSN